jgi:hypothetical protein
MIEEVRPAKAVALITDTRAAGSGGSCSDAITVPGKRARNPATATPSDHHRNRASTRVERPGRRRDRDPILVAVAPRARPSSGGPNPPPTSSRPVDRVMITHPARGRCIPVRQNSGQLTTDGADNDQRHPPPTAQGPFRHRADHQESDQGGQDLIPAKGLHQQGRHQPPVLAALEPQRGAFQCRHELRHRVLRHGRDQRHDDRHHGEDRWPARDAPTRQSIDAAVHGSRVCHPPAGRLDRFYRPRSPIWSW